MFYQNEPLSLVEIDNSRHQQHKENEMESLKQICRLSLVEIANLRYGHGNKIT